MVKLNRKGYLTIEIILASVIAFAIAFFLIEITMKLVNKTDNYYASTVFITDKALITKNVKELIESDINNFGTIINVSCTDNNCNITFDDGTIKVLSINKDEYKVTYGDYTKKFDKSLSGDIDLSCSSSGIVNDKYVMFYISLTNIFEENSCDITIPIVNVKKEEKPELKNYTVYLSMVDRYGNYQSTIEFDNSESSLKNYNALDYCDQCFNSGNLTVLQCYEDEEYNIEYDFESNDSIRYQGYDIYITDNIPSELYCKLTEQW